MSRRERKEAIEELERVRGATKVIVYLTSTRPGLEGQMAMDAISPFYRHLRELPPSSRDRKIDLFLHSNGGEGIVPWRLVTLIRSFCSELTVLVPHHAFSAGTLTALGADKVLMHPMGMLGPTDPSISGPFNPPNPNPNPQNPQPYLPVSVEDVSSYIALVKEDVGIRDEDLVPTFLALADKVHPLALGNVKRATSQSRMLGEKLLRRRSQQMDEAKIREVVGKLTSELFFHGHPINSQEAREDLGLHFVEDAPAEVADAMWNLYELYSGDFRLNEQFNVLREAIEKSPLSVPAALAPQQVPGATGPLMPTPLSQATVKLDPLKFAIIESATRADILQAECELTLTRDQLGNYQCGQPQILRQIWVKDTNPAA